MPEISMPEVRLKDKLPEGLREMTMDDIQKALPEVRLPKVDLGREARNASKAAGRASRAAEKAAARAARHADKAARGAQKAAAKEAGKAARAIEHALPLPRKRGPNPVPIAILFMIGGLVVGWILANSPTTGPRISAWLDELRGRWEEWRGRGEMTDEVWDTTEASAYPESLTPVAAEPYGETLASADAGLGTATSEQPTGFGTTDPARDGADERI